MRSRLAHFVFAIAVIGSSMTAPVASVAVSDPADASQQTGSRWQIEMPAQSVDEAIYRLGVLTGVQIFADGKAVAGRRTKAVSGSYAAEDALRATLAGTGLVVRSAGAGSLMVTAALSESEGEALRRLYSSDLQRKIVATLCGADPGFGAYRLALRMWLSEQGRPENVELLSSTGDHDRDVRIDAMLRGIAASKPPEGLPQPVIMVILPRSPQVSGDCPRGGPADGSRDGR
ncbi:hypothetical protein CCR94_21770 [Rhodoblastus sphagnicola]|uniref:Secretin/TonB short N-terminal domain-containing protein n=1 Tax=Rhodoblastus sphagnicola TaxID=333368 RepID=A0A2S6MWK3_9HYPH|nr:STN domain-containing protein [Rhodoblastus sphagnicola]MBB4200028.1 hypothetical protein [Rhodoblastus sphagnicola]PPQ26737.1 hypothetical protein CCR94_21770 [Rhodoblastus sphagnicola]